MGSTRFFESAWYFGGWTDELQAGEAKEVILAERRIAVYRTETGNIAAIGNRCPHRFAPLHLGKVRGDVLECGYHGLQFGIDGACAYNPHAGGATPTAARVPSYAAIEQEGAIWIWLSTVTVPDPSLIPDFSDLAACPKSATVHIPTMAVTADYELIVDNLLDPTHADYIHQGTLGGAGLLGKARPTIEVGRTWAKVDWDFPGECAVPYLRDLMPDEEVIDTWTSVRWYAPGVVRFEGGIKPAGAGRKDGLWGAAYHILMPVAPGRCNYDVRTIRNYALEDEDLTEKTKEMSRFAFMNQDKPMLEAQQDMIGDAEFRALNPVLFGTDAPAVRVRRVMESLLAEAAVENA